MDIGSSLRPGVYKQNLKAQGAWGTRATSNASNNGVVALGNSCNGEIMIMPAIRNEDGEKVWIALQ